MMAFSAIFVMEADGAPSIMSVTLLPEDPTVEDDINITVDINPDGETVNSVKVEFCIYPTCYEPIFLTDDGSGTSWSGTYPHDNFQNKTGNFNINVSLTGGIYLSRDIYLDFAGIPKELVLDPIELQDTTIYPNQTISVSGRALYDLGYPPEDLSLNLSIPDIGIYETSTGDEIGNFSLTMMVPKEGTHTVNLTATDGNMSAFREWELMVNKWPIPQITLDADVAWDPLEAPPGSDGSEFYTSANITLEYLVSNVGTGLASNMTVNITLENSTLDDLIYVNDLMISNVYEGSKVFNVDTPGVYAINVTVSWDQAAPRDENITDPIWTYPLSIVERPTWDEHTPLVELFTSTTCQYCVAAEEAIERLMHEGDVKFNTISYILDDESSDVIGDARGVVGTPLVKVDHEFISLDSVEGEGTRVELWESAIAKAVTEAARRDTPPVNLRFSQNGTEWSLEMGYSILARDDVAGTLHINLIEEVSDLRRNHQNYPMAYRFIDTILIEEYSTITPGTFDDIVIGDIQQGMGLTAVLYDEYMEVIQTRSIFPHSSPGLFMEKGNIVLESESPGETTFPITFEIFPMDEGTFPDQNYSLVAEDIPAGWAVKVGDIDLASEAFEGTLTHAYSDHEVLPDGRNRYFGSLEIDLIVPGSSTGYSSFTLVLTTDWRVTEKGVLVETYINDPGTVKNETAIERVWLESEGMNLYLFAEVTDLPDGGTVNGWVQPCMEGDSGYCGAPIDIILIEVTSGIYKGTIQGIDLNTFSHLTYRASIVVDGLDLVVSEDEKKPISDYITITPASGEKDDDESPWALIGAVIVFALIIIVIVVLAIIRSAGGTGRLQDHPSDGGEDRTISTEELDAMIQDFPIPPMPITHHPVGQEPGEQEGSPPQEDDGEKRDDKPKDNGQTPTVEEGQQEPPTTGEEVTPSEGDMVSPTPLSEDTTQAPILKTEEEVESGPTQETKNGTAQGPTAEPTATDQV